METDSDFILNEHNKDEFAPAHTAEHLLNQTMIRMFGCKRSTNAHVERKKSKITYILERKLIGEDLPVRYKYVTRQDIPDDVELTNLPDNTSETIRLVYIGDYDVCPCIGKHVRSTAQIGRFELLGTNWDEQTHGFRIRYKVVQ